MKSLIDKRCRLLCCSALGGQIRARAGKQVLLMNAVIMEGLSKMFSKGRKSFQARKILFLVLESRSDYYVGDKSCGNSQGEIYPESGTTVSKLIAVIGD